MISKFDHYLTPETKKSWLILFSVCNLIILSMYFLGYNDVEIGSNQFYIGMIVLVVMVVLGIALGRGLNVWYKKGDYRK